MNHSITNFYLMHKHNLKLYKKTKKTVYLGSHEAVNYSTHVEYDVIIFAQWYK